MNKEFVIGEGLKGVVSRAWTKPERITVQAACTALRDCLPMSHDELVTLNAAYAAMLKKTGVLSADCVRVVVDAQDEITGQIENDRCEQQAEAMWADNKRVMA